MSDNQPTLEEARKEFEYASDALASTIDELDVSTHVSGKPRAAYYKALRRFRKARAALSAARSRNGLEPLTTRIETKPHLDGDSEQGSFQTERDRRRVYKKGA